MRASQRGHEAAVTSLLRHDAQVDFRNEVSTMQKKPFCPCKHVVVVIAESSA